VWQFWPPVVGAEMYDHLARGWGYHFFRGIQPRRISKRSAVGRYPMKARAAFLILLGLGLGGVSGASAQECTPAPTMTIKIFNDETDKWLYPVISVGPKPGAAGDVWIQACFKIKNKDLNANTYRTTLVYRIYIEPEGVGIAPGKSVSITIPLYTQIAQVPNPALPNQYIEWWQGGRLELYANDKPEPPRS
jgi:hypothetical protein